MNTQAVSRRTAIVAAAGAVTAACGGRADLISFDRGEFALTYATLFTFGQNLLSTAIAKNTKAGVANAYAQGLQRFLDQINEVDVRVRKEIIEAPQKAKDAQTVGLGEIAGILSKAAPLILPLLAAL